MTLQPACFNSGFAWILVLEEDWVSLAPCARTGRAGVVTNRVTAPVVVWRALLLCWCSPVEQGRLPAPHRKDSGGGNCAYKRGSLSPRYSQRKCLLVQDGYFCVPLCVPPHCCLICGKCPSLSQQMDLAPLVGRIRVVHPVGRSLFFDWVPWSMNFLRKARDGSRTSLLPVPLFQFPPFGRAGFDFLSLYYYGLWGTALKLALRRWKGRGIAVGSLVWRM